jgi:hypothetical protein
VSGAALASGCSPRTAQRRLGDAAFRQQVLAARSRLVDQAVGLLAGSAAQAATVLTDLLEPTTPPALRLRAAVALLAEVGRALERGELEQRLQALEAVVEAEVDAERATARSA